MRTCNEYNSSDEADENSGKAAPSHTAECNIGLALNMQPYIDETTYPLTKNISSSLYHHHQPSIDFSGLTLLFGNSPGNQIAPATSFFNTASGSKYSTN